MRESSWSIEGETVVVRDNVTGTGTLAFQIQEYTTEDYFEKVCKYRRKSDFNDLLYIEVCKLSK